MPKYQMLINYVAGEECRIAIAKDGKLEELYQERSSAESHVGNIYKAKVTNIEPSIQAAFVDFGLERNGFLHITDLHPKYFPGEAKEPTERVGHKTPHRDRPPIQKCLHRGQEILIQVLKEGIGTKGPTVTSYLSIPGRYLVMMPHMERLGVSRKVEDDDARREMRKILDGISPPKDFGFIVRTAGTGKTKTDLKRDLAYLQRLWKNLERRRKKLPNVGELYTESDLVIRTLRDIYTSDIEEIIIDNANAARRASEFLSIISPRTGSKVLAYKDPIPLYHRYDIERQIESINEREVPLPSGGSLVIDSAEALVAIDVNSGKSRNAKDAEMNAYQTNIEATDEICRQLRLRDLGGVIVNDLIDMRETKHRRAIEQRFRNNLKNDRARTRINAISQFGILEMTRQRMRPSLKKSIYVDCPACQGRGHTKSTESVLLHVMRRLALVLHHQQVSRVDLTISPDVAFQLLNRKRSELVRLEKMSGKSVMVRVSTSGAGDYIAIDAFDSRNAPVKAESLKNLPKPILEPAKDLPEFGDLEPQEAFDFEAELEAEAEQQEEEQRPPSVQEILGEAPPEDETDSGKDNGESKSKRRRRRGGRGRGKSRKASQKQGTDEGDQKQTKPDAEDHANGEDGKSSKEDEGKSSRSRRRRGGRGRRRRNDRDGQQQTQQNGGGENTQQKDPGQVVKQPKQARMASEEKTDKRNDSEAKTEQKSKKAEKVKSPEKIKEEKTSDKVAKIAKMAEPIGKTKPSDKPIAEVKVEAKTKSAVKKKVAKKKTSKKKTVKKKASKASKATKKVTRKKASRKKKAVKSAEDSSE